jgi:hypothetical protein
VDGSLDKQLSFPHKLLTINNGQLSCINTNSPSWAKSLIDEIIFKINNN